MEHERSPESNLGPERKRRRKVLSCMDCRRRKLQCDRNVPVCGRCEKAGKPCSYEDDSSSQQAPSGQGASYTPRQQSVTVSFDVWNDMLSRLLQQEREISRLQTGYASPGTPATISIATPQVHGNVEIPGGHSDPAAKETIALRGKGFKSVYYGPSDARSSMTLIPDAHNFFREEISRNPELVRCRRDVARLREVKKILEREAVPPPSKNLIAYLPERVKVDLLVRLYLDNVDPIYGILHFPTFHREYEEMWRDPMGARPVFVATVLLMMACCQCLIGERPQVFMADSPLPREQAITLVQACESWLAKASQKHTDLSWFQVQCLLLVAKQAHFMKMKRRWVDSGNLLRLAISAGMHRNPELLQKKTSSFEYEMRKRIWAFIVEWDLQTSIDRGMPAVSLDVASDCGPPSNLHDTDFDESTVIMRPPRPLTELTKMTYICLSSQSRALRKRLITMINQPLHSVSYDQVLSCTQELDLNLASLPDWTGHQRRDLGAYDQSIALLHIQLEQFLLILHSRAARQAVSKTQATFSKQAFKSAAASILDKLSDLWTKRSTFLVMVRAEIQRIFTSIITLGSIQDKNTSTSELQSLVQPCLELADKALGLLEEKILATGGLQWTHTFAVYDMLLCKIHPLGRNMGSRPGSEKIYSICKKILDHQDPDFTSRAAPLKDSMPTPKKKKAGNETTVAAAIDDDGAQAAAFSNSDLLPSLNYTEMLDWNFDDWMLHTDMFWLPQTMSLPPLSQQNLQ